MRDNTTRLVLRARDYMDQQDAVIYLSGFMPFRSEVGQAHIECGECYYGVYIGGALVHKGRNQGSLFLTDNVPLNLLSYNTVWLVITQPAPDQLINIVVCPPAAAIEHLQFDAERDSASIVWPQFRPDNRLIFMKGRAATRFSDPNLQRPVHWRTNRGELMCRDNDRYSIISAIALLVKGAEDGLDCEVVHILPENEDGALGMDSTIYSMPDLVKVLSEGVSINGVPVPIDHYYNCLRYYDEPHGQQPIRLTTVADAPALRYYPVILDLEPRSRVAASDLQIAASVYDF